MYGRRTASETATAKYKMASHPEEAYLPNFQFYIQSRFLLQRNTEFHSHTQKKKTKTEFGMMWNSVLGNKIQENNSEANCFKFNPFYSLH